MSTTTTDFKPSLGLLDATMIVAGSMIGSGIFIVSADIMRNVGSAGWLVVVWLITGFMTLTAALSYGELSAMFPKAGGQYVYLKESYNPLLGFLYGWSFFSVIQTGTIAAVGVAFSKFAGYFFPGLEMNDANILFQLGFLKVYPAQLVSIAIIVLLTFINTKGVQGGKLIQSTFTVTKLLSLFGLIGFGFLLASKASIWNANWQDAWSMKQIATDGGTTPIFGVAILGAIAASMVGSIFSSDAWNNVTFIAGEIKNPKRNIGLSLFLGTLIASLLVRYDPNPIDRLTSFSIPILLLAIPILDTTVAVVSRLRRRNSPFHGGKDHLSHRLMRFGFSRKKTAITLWALTGFFGSLALVISNAPYHLERTLLYLGTFIWIVLIAFFLRQRDE